MKTIRDWPLNEAFPFIMPASLLTMSNTEISNTILKIYRDWRQLYDPYLVFPWYKLAANVTWKWMDHQLKPLPRRLMECLYENGKFKLSSSFWGDLGNELREKIPLAPRTIMRITNEFNWNAGEFGDHHSCMWESRSGTRRAMSQSGKFFALQLYNIVRANDACTAIKIKDDTTTYYSSGRCWVYPTLVTLDGVEEPITVIFNSYGPTPLQQIGILVQGLMEADGTKRIKVSNRGSTSGGLYVNSGGGLLIGSEKAISLIDHIDFSFRTNYESGLLQFGIPRRGIRTNTGAVLNVQGPSLHEKRKKKRKSQHHIQQDEYRYHKGQLLKNRNKDDRYLRYVISSSQMREITQKRIAGKARFSNAIKYMCKTNASYRGTTKSEIYMYGLNRARLSNIMWSSDRLEDEFPRQSKRWRSKFYYYMTLHHKNIWSWLTYQLKQSIEV